MRRGALTWTGIGRPKRRNMQFLAVHAKTIYYIVMAEMIPAGYMAKRIFSEPDCVRTLGVEDVYSVSGCMVRHFADYINFWKHNGYWLFDSPETIRGLALENAIDISGTIFFYYEVYCLEFSEDDHEWRKFSPNSSFVTNVAVPEEKSLEGFDVVTFSVGTGPECSPLSCNMLAVELKVNRHCLLDSLEEARQYLEDGRFRNAESGPYRIFAVYTL
jgi:hypothetical protein